MVEAEGGSVVISHPHDRVAGRFGIKMYKCIRCARLQKKEKKEEEIEEEQTGGEGRGCNTSGRRSNQSEGEGILVKVHMQCRWKVAE